MLDGAAVRSRASAYLPVIFTPSWRETRRAREQVMRFGELEDDHLNPTDFSREVNKMFPVEMALHAVSQRPFPISPTIRLFARLSRSSSVRLRIRACSKCLSTVDVDNF